MVLHICELWECTKIAKFYSIPVKCLQDLMSGLESHIHSTRTSQERLDNVAFPDLGISLQRKVKIRAELHAKKLQPLRQS